ncbi:UvrD-helicase domain-containing protein [bacterium]|nr:UvrD-helicase domain-containing protein [bacterium]
MSFELSSEQRTAIDARGPVCVTASAGSGKTAVLVERYCAALASGLTPDQILTVTFTRKAGQQLRDRLIEKLREAPESTRESIAHSPWIGTLHGFCLQVVRQWSRLLENPPIGTVLEPLERAALMPEVKRAWFRKLSPALQDALFTYWSPQDLSDIAEEALQRPHDCREVLDRPVESPPARLLISALNHLLDLWNDALRGQDRFTFDDLEYNARVLLRRFEPVRQHYQGLFKLVLVDEFQDTSPGQWEILNTLCATDSQKLFVVGDPKQSIYRFRQADVHLFLSLRESLSAQGGEAVELNTCYRARPKLVEDFNRLSGRLFDAALSQMVSGREEKCQTPGFETLRYGGKTSGETVEAERRAVAARVAERVRAGVKPSEVALLFRASERMERFAEALGDLGIPVSCEPIQRLFSFYEVRDLATFLRAVAMPKDDFTLSAFLLSPYGGFSPERLFALKTSGPGPLLDRLYAKEQLRWFTELLKSPEKEPLSLLERLFGETGKFPARGAVLYRLLEGLNDCPSLEQALKLLDAWEKDSVAVSAPLANTVPHGVRLLTVHGSKGLEFEEVYLVDALRKPPNHRSWLAWDTGALGVRYRQDGEVKQSPEYEALCAKSLTEDRAEDNRILYVAVTRAKERVVICLPEDKSPPPGSWAERLTGLSS